MSNYQYSDLECKIIMNQIDRRAKYRQEFMKLRSDPCAHSKEAGYVFDPAVQRFLSLKACELNYFYANPRTIRWGLFGMLMPMVVYGYVIWQNRQKWLKEIECGNIKPKDRIFKLQ